MFMKTKKRIVCLNLIIIFILGFAFSFSVDKAHWNWWDWADAILSDVEANAMNKSDIVDKYCSAMLENLDVNTFLSFTQSIFVANLCNSWEVKNNDRDFKAIKELVQEDFSYKKANFQSSCRKGYKEDCNLAELADNLLTLTLSEYFTIREASAFWIKWGHKKFSSNETLKEWETQFVENYLWVSKQRDFCKNNHKQTCLMLEKQMKQFKKALKNIQIVNLENLYEKEVDCKTENNVKNNMLYCWLVGEVQWWLNRFAELVYNELQWYTIFISYYWQIISQRENISEEIKNEYLQSMAWPQKFISLVEETMRDLNDIVISYPLHVTLVAFQEDLLRLRDKYLVKVVTPIYCLYYKLRNVQFDK